MSLDEIGMTLDRERERQDDRPPAHGGLARIAERQPVDLDDLERGLHAGLERRGIRGDRRDRGVVGIAERQR